MLLNTIKKILSKQRIPAQAESYKTMEIEATVKVTPRGYCLAFEVLDQGSFFTKDIFVNHVEELSRLELFYNYSALGMNMDELQKYGATHKVVYAFDSYEDAKKAKDTTIQYIRFLITEHQQVSQKIS
ncbi:hypothetical protein [Paenibacillus thalictri]|uniref:Uncharacterized protein n=1 Tax=Paenibacillus thalictri TaxID=2527873 RepID=A0A4Q9DW13_9BACL|nr:hypothetical protein [Paenibacillus thalictri]TBL79993.1 hypothetical protein EYB31_10445 [Paenibacillus thalictri]